MKNKQIEALEKLIALKDETIKELEKQIQLFKNQPPVVITQPQQPIQPWLPNIPYNPTYPWYQPYIVTTSGTSISTPLTGGQLPLGSIQMGSITNDPTATYTLTNSDSSTNVIDFKTCSRV